MQQKHCGVCKSAFTVDETDEAFYEKISPRFRGKTYAIPSPTLCPDCRSRRRMVWRNERSLYQRECGLCGKMKVSMFAPSLPYRTYCHDCWWSDAWDPLSYGRDAKPGEDFVGVMDALLRSVPLVLLFQSGTNENCEYTNYFGPDARNCYLSYNGGRDENCSYTRGLIESESCLDILIGSGNRYCGECINANDCYRVFHCENVFQSSDSAFLFNCRGCKNCFGCTNLAQKEYYVWNEPSTKEEYERHMADLRSAEQVSQMEQKFSELKRSCIHREHNNVNTENCTGDYLASCKNCHDSFEMKGSEDCRHMLCAKLTKDSQDLFGFGYDSELLYEGVGTGLSTRVSFSWICARSTDSLYCFQCNNVKNCFGCVGLRHKEYCIFNKQYTKEEYEKTVATLIESMGSAWGEFLPWSISPFAYNETVAQEFLPLTEAEAKHMGFRWDHSPPPHPAAAKTIAAAMLPDTIDEIPDDILNWAIECEETGKAFKITKQELHFYREMGLSIPRAHPDERHRRRMARRNPCKLWARTCKKCDAPIQTTYQPSRPEIVYCESCYLQTVY